MTDEYPEARSGQQEQENQTLDTERAVVEAPVTGDARVDDAIVGLSRLPGRPVEEHVAILEEAYGRLRDILDDLGPGQH